MDLLSLGFVLLISLASGGIAYAADRLGKKLGKKRMSLRFGRINIRPKHVASLGTAGMGVITSFLTILFIALVSRDARDWLVQGRGLLVEQGKLKRELGQLKSERQEAEKAKAKIVQDLSGVQRKLGTAQKEVEKQNGELALLGQKRDRLIRETSRLTAQVKSISQKLLLSQEKLRGTQSSLLAANRQLALSEKQVLQAKQTLALVRNDLGSTQKSLEFANKQKDAALKLSRDTYFALQKNQAKVADLESQAKTQEELVSKLHRDIEGLTDQRNVAERQVDGVIGRLAMANAKLEQAGKDLAELEGLAQSQYLFLATTFRSSRMEPVTYRIGEEVARVVVPARADETTAAGALASLLQSAQSQAAARGAKPKRDKDGKVAFGTADVFGHQNSKTGAVTSGADLKQAVVAGAVGKAEPQVLVATSSLNAFAGESVSLEINVVPNPLVYHRNDLVAEARIDGSLDEDRIFGQVTEFVGSRIRERARDDRMILGPGTGAPFGEVKTSEVWALVREVKRVGRSVRVQAYAENDIRAADPLRLEFRVR